MKDKHGLNPEERRLAQVLPDEIIKVEPTTVYFAGKIDGVRVEIEGPARYALELIARLRGE